MLAHDGVGHFHQRFGARLQALDQPAGLLQLAAHPAGVLAAGLCDQAAVMLVQPQSRLGVGVQAHAPVVAVAQGVDIRRHVFHRCGVQRGAGARVQAADQQGRAGHVFLAGAQVAGQLGDVVACQQFQLAVDQPQGQVAVGCVRVELFQLHPQAIAQVQAGHADRVETLQQAAHHLDLLDAGVEAGGQGRQHGIQPFGEVAGGVQRVDQHGRDGMLARVERGQVELPHQVLLQGFRRRVLRFEILIPTRAG